MKRSGRRSLFLTLLCVFLSIIAPLYLLCFGIYRWGVNMTTNEILQSLRAQSTYFLETLADEIGRIRQLQYQCLNDTDLYYFVNAHPIMSTFDRFEALLALQNRLYLMANSSNYIEDVRVYIPHMNRMISSDKGVDRLSTEWVSIAMARADQSEAGIVYAEGRMYLCSAYPMFPADPESTPLYILITKLSSDNIRSLLLSFNLYEDGGTVLTNLEQSHSLRIGKSIGLPSLALGDDILSTENHVIEDEGGQPYIVVGAASEYLHMELYSYVSEEAVYGGLYQYRTLFSGFTVVALALALAFLWSANILVNRPIKRLIRSLQQVEQGRFQERIDHHSRDEFSYLYNAFNHMAESLETLIETNYRQRMLTQQAELRQLQAQINPHFLHNSFFILYRMAKDREYESIAEFLTYLSDYYRFITRNAQMEVPLREEARHAYRYAQIQTVRFHNRLSVDFRFPPDPYGDMMVPRLILQPLLENAFHHGLKDVTEDGRLWVWFERDGPHLIAKVEDNGAGLDDAAYAELAHRLADAGDGVESRGIINIHKRLQLKFGGGCGLRIIRPSAGGVRFELALPAAFPEAAAEKRAGGADRQMGGGGTDVPIAGGG